jgi:hypothetical protein
LVKWLNYNELEWLPAERVNKLYSLLFKFHSANCTAPGPYLPSGALNYAGNFPSLKEVPRYQFALQTGAFSSDIMPVSTHVSTSVAATPGTLAVVPYQHAIPYVSQENPNVTPVPSIVAPEPVLLSHFPTNVLNSQGDHARALLILK